MEGPPVGVGPSVVKGGGGTVDGSLVPPRSHSVPAQSEYGSATSSGGEGRNTSSQGPR